MSMLDARTRLAAEQTALLRALVGGDEPPAGFDNERVRLTARSLINKRLREVARAWPALSHCLGDQFNSRFTLFAGTHPPPAEGGPLADGRAFARTLAASEMDAESGMELLRVDLYQRWLPARLRWLPRVGRIVGVRLPWLGVCVSTVRIREWFRGV